jgi:hypothetical protein
MLMNPDRRRVDHLEIPVVRPRDGVEELVPDTHLPPANEAVVASCGWPIALGDIGPGRTCPDPPVDPVQHSTIIYPRHPAGLVRKQWLDDRPLEIGQFVATWGHDRSSTELDGVDGPRPYGIALCQDGVVNGPSMRRSRPHMQVTSVKVVEIPV